MFNLNGKIIFWILCVLFVLPLVFGLDLSSVIFLVLFVVLALRSQQIFLCPWFWARSPVHSHEKVVIANLQSLFCLWLDSVFPRIASPQCSAARVHTPLNFSWSCSGLK
jgi:hypothetical protein